MEEKKDKLPCYPGLKIERAVNGWVLRELADDYEDRVSWIATSSTDLLDLISRRLEELEIELEAGKLRI